MLSDMSCRATFLWIGPCALLFGVSACAEEKKSPRTRSESREAAATQAAPLTSAEEERNLLQAHLRAQAEQSVPPRPAEPELVGLLEAGAGADPGAQNAPWGDPALHASADPLMADSGLGGLGLGLGQGRRSKPPSVRMGATSVSGRLPPEVIQRIVRQNFGRFRLCYENGLRSNPNLAGRVTISFVIGRSGEVGAVTSHADLPDTGVVGCVTRAFYGLSFPAPETGVVKVSYPIVFAPGDATPRATINGKTPASVTFDDIKAALERHGCSGITLLPDPKGSRKSVMLTARLDGMLVSVVFATTKDAIPPAEIVSLESRTAFHRDGDFVLSIGIEADTDNAKARQLLKKVISS